MFKYIINIKNKRGHGASVKVVKKSSPIKLKMLMLKKVLFVVFLCAFLILIGMNSRTLVNDINQQRIEFVSIETSLTNVTVNDIKITVFDFINRSMVAVDLLAIKNALEENAWINTVSLRRKWPNTLIINVSEEVAIARWGERELLNQNGALFSPLLIEAQINLAKLSGPNGTEKIVMQQYQIFNQLLLPKNLRIASLNLNTRGSWSIQLSNETKVVVGSIQAVGRLRRFVAVYEVLFADQIESISGFDLRYEDGIAVKHKDLINDALLSMRV